MRARNHLRVGWSGEKKSVNEESKKEIFSGDMKNKGWAQLRAGKELIVWSKLARWENDSCRFQSVNEQSFETSPEGQKSVHPTFGRLICWIAFEVGSEYLVRGILLLKDKNVSGEEKPVPKFPDDAADEFELQNWAQIVNRTHTSDDMEPASQYFEKVPTNKNFGKLRPMVKEIIEGNQNQELVLAGLRLLGDTIRNRDAHHYTQNVRTFHFHTVKQIFVPVFNELLATLNQDELCSELSKQE